MGKNGYAGGQRNFARRHPDAAEYVGHPAPSQARFVKNFTSGGQAAIYLKFAWTMTGPGLVNPMNRKIAPFFAGFAAIVGSLGFAGEIEFTVSEVEFELNGKTYASKIVAPEPSAGLATVFMIPNWMGVTDRAVEKAKRVSDGRYVVYVADVYGKEVRPANASEAGEAAGALRADRTEMRNRGNAALDHFRAHAPELRADGSRLAAIGFCFGGGAVLEMARSGTDARAFVSFHGDLASPTLADDSEKISGKILVLHGAADPLVPPDHVHAFEAAMGSTEVDWTLISYGGAVHSFTDPTAAMEGTAMYCERTAQRAFRAMWQCFEEVLID